MIKNRSSPISNLTSKIDHTPPSDPARADEFKGMKQWITFGADDSITMRYVEGIEGDTQKHKVKYPKDGVIEPVIDDADAPPDTKIKLRCTIDGEHLKIEMEGIGIVEFERVQDKSTKPVEKTTEAKPEHGSDSKNAEQGADGKPPLAPNAPR